MNSNDSSLARWAHRLDWLAIGSGHVLIWMLLPMVLALTWEVAARYLFNAPTIWAYDMTFMLYGSFFMLGCAYTLQRKAHVRTDSFYQEWSPRRQAITDLVCYVLMFLPVVVVFMVWGWGYFWKAFQTNETFVSSSWQPVTWPFKLSMPLAGFLLLVQGVSECLKSIYAVKYGSWPDPATVPEVSV